MRWQSKRGQRLWKATSGRSRVMLAGAVFFTFSALGVLLDVPRSTHPPLWSFAIYVVLFGVVGVAYVFATVWDIRLIPAAIGIQIALSAFGDWATERSRVAALGPVEQHARLVLDAFTCFNCIVLGYGFFIRFVHSIARGHARLQTEVTLAKGIHDALVPTVSGRSNRADYYGRSQASGAMGGDLVDVFEGPRGTTFYLVDVSGHGVGAGVLMAMLKSASRAALAGGVTLPTLLGGLNRTIHELGRPGTFATCACLHVSRSGETHYALAGHHPIVQRRASSGELSELLIGGPLLGLQEHEQYESVIVEAAEGDVFLLFTDGLMEVFQRDGREFGMEGVRTAAFADGAATQYGRQLDDQTVLFVRITAPAALAPKTGIASGRIAPAGGSG